VLLHVENSVTVIPREDLTAWMLALPAPGQLTRHPDAAGANRNTAGGKRDICSTASESHVCPSSSVLPRWVGLITRRRPRRIRAVLTVATDVPHQGKVDLWTPWTAN
jgi:hypothetical protein